MTLKIEAGKKYRTRGGDEVEILRTDLQSDMPVLGILRSSNEGHSLFETRPFEEYPGTWTSSGGWVWVEEGEEYEDVNDIISEIKLKRVVWMNVYEEDEGACFFPSRQKADDEDRKYGDINGARIACIRVEFEEGQFDE